MNKPNAQQAGDDPELAAVYASARHPSQAQPAPRVSLGLRLRTSPHARGLVPNPLAVRLTAARARATWRRHPAERAPSLAAMQTLLGDTPRAAEIEPLAREHFVERRVLETMFWQPWRLARMDEHSLQRLRDALDSPRGVVLSACHQGPFFAQLSLVCKLGAKPHISSGRWFFEPPSPDAWGRRLARWWYGLRDRDQFYIPAEGSYEAFRVILHNGLVAMIYFDMPGSRETRFLGKQVRLASGSARLSCETDALVLPIRGRREGHRTWLDVAEPLDPRAYADDEALHAALARLHEGWLLERPAGVEDPNRAGSWGAQRAGGVPA
jgi:lauroyl/myristoyl acyltransferase